MKQHFKIKCAPASRFLVDYANLWFANPPYHIGRIL